MKITLINKVAWLIALPMICYGIVHIVITLAASKMGITLDPPAEMSWDYYQDWIRTGAWYREAMYRDICYILLPLLVVLVLNVIANPKMAPIAKYVRSVVSQLMRLLCTPTKLIPILGGTVILLLLLGQIFELPGRTAGVIIANIDTMCGRYKIKCCGLPSSSASLMGKLLRTHYGVEREQIAGCIVTTWQMGYSSGYNSVSSKRIQKKFKKDYLFQEVSYLAQRMWEDRYRGSNLVQTLDGFVIPDATLKRTSADPSFGYTLSNPVKLNGGKDSKTVMVYLRRLRDGCFYEDFTVSHQARFRVDNKDHFVERYTLTGHQGKFQIFFDPAHSEIQESNWMAPTGMWLDPKDNVQLENRRE